MRSASPACDFSLGRFRAREHKPQHQQTIISKSRLSLFLMVSNGDYEAFRNVNFDRSSVRQDIREAVGTYMILYKVRLLETGLAFIQFEPTTNSVKFVDVTP